MREDADGRAARRSSRRRPTRTRASRSRRILHYYRGVAAMRAGDRARGLRGVAVCPEPRVRQRRPRREPDRPRARGGSRAGPGRPLAGPRQPDQAPARLGRTTASWPRPAAWPTITWAMTRRRRANGRSPPNIGARPMNWTPTDTWRRTWPWPKKRWRTGSMPPRPGARWCAAGRAKTDHPDYLTDAQVAALWNHAAECYERAEQVGEVETCLRNAIKYAPDDTALRSAPGRCPAEPGARRRGRDPASGDHDARAAARRGAGAPGPALRGVVGSRSDADLAAGAGHQPGASLKPATRWPNDYVKLVSDESPMAVLPYLACASRQEPRSNPGDRPAGVARAIPGCWWRWAWRMHAQNQPKQAREYLLQAYRAAPQDVRIVGSVLHELLHAEAGDAVKDLTPAVRQIPTPAAGLLVRSGDAWRWSASSARSGRASSSRKL